ncbi:MAG: response regulator transcription factor [Ruminococcus sp.]|jgi:DNA-binding response OmpR family regulator|nr:response regulator transcription factor [Ruminococcus sp.]
MIPVLLMIEDSTDILDLNEAVIDRFFEGKIRILKCLSIAEAKGIIFDTGKEIDVILLDINLPDGNGLNLLPEIRGRSNASVIVLSAKNTKEDIIKGLSQGGDDYISKPYDLDELCVRVMAAIRRKKKEVDILRGGRLKIDTNTLSAYLDGENLSLTPKEFSILMIFLENEGKTLSTEFIYEEIWKRPMIGDSLALQKHISNLKSKLERSDFMAITNLRSRGYVFEISQNFFTK